ncbi:MAG: fluoride efflux transporter CrcB, partial [Verrucomicrobia bacterium]
MFSYFVVAIGGALGSVGRFWLSGTIAQKFGETFPAGTLLVNVSGSLIIGFFSALTGPDGRIWS